MVQLSTNDLQLLDTAGLTERAEAVRDAVTAKSVSARQVGQLFCDLIDACGDINRAVRLFLSVNVPELQKDIDSRLAGADAAAEKAAAETQRSERTRALVEELVAKLSTQNLNAPERIDITAAAERVTLSNPVPQKIGAALFPRFSLGSVLFIGDRKAVDVTPDGVVRPVALGRSTVHAVATADTSVYESLCIEVVPPRLRLAASGALRLDGKGNLRLT